jgi:transposase
MLATALVASVADPKTFRSGRNFSAWIGLEGDSHHHREKKRLHLWSPLSARRVRRNAGKDNATQHHNPTAPASNG